MISASCCSDSKPRPSRIQPIHLNIQINTYSRCQIRMQSGSATCSLCNAPPCSVGDFRHAHNPGCCPGVHSLSPVVPPGQRQRWLTMALRTRERHWSGKGSECSLRIPGNVLWIGSLADSRAEISREAALVRQKKKLLLQPLQRLRLGSFRREKKIAAQSGPNRTVE